jgi:biotin carboxyl carrier protein
MRYFVTIGDRTLEVELAGDVPTVDGVPVAADLAALPGAPIRHLLADNRCSTVVARAGEQSGVWQITLGGIRFAAEVLDQRTRDIRAVTGTTAAAAGPRPVRAPMPGLIVRVEVEPGQEVRAGQPIVIMEAMKMENELRAEVAGRVAQVVVSAGQAVEKGAILVEFEAG